MDTTEPCKICGCTQSNLVDGFYYCVECGTQDTNVRETLVEYTILRDGAVAIAAKRRVRQIPKGNEFQMTDDWYKWHGLNFLLQGLADEVIELGAAPSFKTKLLWVWTRYMKKYQNKADFGLDANDSDENKEDIEESVKNDNEYISDDEEQIRAKMKKHTVDRDVKKISMPLIISFLYVALNLDKSAIQLTHLMRFMREGRVSIINWQKLVPAELRPKRLRKILLVDQQWFIYSMEHIRVIGLELFRKLDLGNPIVPDLRPLVEQYLRELCLPNNLKELVFSLMHFRSFDYLDINVKYPEMRRIPSYELYVMSHILLAVKICFGLDDEYEIKLSNAVDKINNVEDHPKSYNSQPTGRLFNFRDWSNYIQFRKALLRTHTLYLGEPNYFDMNDYVAFEHQRERPDYVKFFKDEIAADIINKIPTSELNVIPKSEFVPTMTPHVSYTRVIVEHQQDPNVKRLLSEDFTQYSLNYIIKDMFLVDHDSMNPENIITGVSECNVQQTKKAFQLIVPNIRFPKGMVYVKDCDNHNWILTRRPQLEHITSSEKINDSDEKENDHGYVSNSDTLQSLTKTNNINSDDIEKSAAEAKENSLFALNDNKEFDNDLNSTIDIEMTDKEERSEDAVVVDSSTNINSETNVFGNVNEDIKLITIREEDEGNNIFDDDFIDLEIKKEEENFPKEMELDEMEPEYNNDVAREAQPEYRQIDNDSDASSVDSIRFKPESLDRDEAIKELIFHACNKYKVSLPGKYKLFKKKTKCVRKKFTGRVGPNFKGETHLKINGLISAYHARLEEDILNQMSNMVQTAIAHFNPSKESEETIEPGGLPHINDEMDTANDQSIENEPGNTNEEQNPDQNETETVGSADDSKYKLFSDSSDGETCADDLLPKKNPEFDEETHDISQLYIKPADNPDVPEMKLNPKLIEIVNRKIEADNNGQKLEQDKTDVSSDSEEDVCISVLQEQKRIREQLTEQQNRTKAKLLRPLIQNRIPMYKFWLRHYYTQITSVTKLNERFANEIDAKLPKSFVFVLKECADVVGYPPFNIYKGLQRVEECIKYKYAKGKMFVPKYVEKEHNSSLTRKYLDF